MVIHITPPHQALFQTKALHSSLPPLSVKLVSLLGASVSFFICSSRWGRLYAVTDFHCLWNSWIAYRFTNWSSLCWVPYRGFLSNSGLIRQQTEVWIFSATSTKKVGSDFDWLCLWHKLVLQQWQLLTDLSYMPVYTYIQPPMQLSTLHCLKRKCTPPFTLTTNEKPLPPTHSHLAP